MEAFEKALAEFLDMVAWDASDRCVEPETMLGLSPSLMALEVSRRFLKEKLITVVETDYSEAEKTLESSESAYVVVSNQSEIALEKRGSFKAMILDMTNEEDSMYAMVHGASDGCLMMLIIPESNIILNEEEVSKKAKEFENFIASTEKSEREMYEEYGSLYADLRDSEYIESTSLQRKELMKAIRTMMGRQGGRKPGSAASLINSAQSLRLSDPKEYAESHVLAAKIVASLLKRMKAFGVIATGSVEFNGKNFRIVTGELMKFKKDKQKSLAHAGFLDGVVSYRNYGGRP